MAPFGEPLTFATISRVVPLVTAPGKRGWYFRVSKAVTDANSPFSIGVRLEADIAGAGPESR
jgi:hypothetical protein